MSYCLYSLKFSPNCSLNTFELQSLLAPMLSSIAKRWIKRCIKRKRVVHYVENYMKSIHSMTFGIEKCITRLHFSATKLTIFVLKYINRIIKILNNKENFLKDKVFQSRSILED